MQGWPSKALGWVESERVFRLVALKATAVSLVLRRHPEDPDEVVRPMQRQPDGDGFVWEVAEPDPATYYRYRVVQGDETIDIADPWSLAVARQFRLGHPTWSVARRTAFDWQGDVRPGTDVGHAIISEVHVRDFTAHPSAGNPHPGTYLGLADAAAPGGLGALRDLGITCVELMPVTSFPVLEPIDPPAGQPAHWGNPTGMNHWGYMPSFLLVPSERYSVRGANAAQDEWVGVDADGTFHDPGVELKRMVRALHRAGIAVIIDVVFNHVSTHDDNPLIRLDPGSWLHRESDGVTLRSHSGCGNDLNTSDPAMHRLVLDAVRHWMREYHVDGFRLDLATILDDRTLRDVRTATREEYPHAILISEPWSMAGYRPGDLAEFGHTVWNDRFRNGLKGNHPQTGRGFLFGRGDGGAPRSEIAALLGGWERVIGGHFETPKLSLNYLESHDNYTLGDFVRLALGEVRFDEQVERQQVAELTPQALRVHKLAAALLLLSRGSVMMAQGQEWARSKVQAGSMRGYLDGNSYNRDDATNHLDWTERTRNPDLVDEYRRLITLRKDWLLPAFSTGEAMHFLAGSCTWALGYGIDGSRGRLAVLLNGESECEAWFNLPGGAWWLLFGAENAEVVPIDGGVTVRVQPTSAIVLYCA